MKFFIVFCYLCLHLLDASVAYNAGILHFDKEFSIKEYASFIYEARKENVDILVLPPPQLKEIKDDFDQRVKHISNAAHDAGLYVVATLYEKTNCGNVIETVKTNVVFNRNGAVIADYRKPVSSLANCTSTSSDLVTFTTDFGVTFGLLMDEDIVLHDANYLKGLKNFVMTVGNVDRSLVDGAQLSSAWSYVNDVNLISIKGIYTGKCGLKTGSGRLVTVEIDSNRGSETSAVPVVNCASFITEDLRQYITKPLNMEASIQGYTATVCHRSFCCEFYVQTADTEVKPDVIYNMAVFDGVHPFIPHHNIGVQTCGIFATSDGVTGKLKTTDKTNVIFKRISISANFSKENVEYPIVHTSILPAENFRFVTKTSDSKQVTMEIVDGQNVFSVAIFSRDFSKDFDNFVQKTSSENYYNIYDLIFNEDVQEFFDYVWIRLRILIVVVSIYVLEML